MPVLPITLGYIRTRADILLGFVEGSWVFGFFKDSYLQVPYDIGSLFNQPSETAQSNGFYDPNKVFPRYINDPDTNRFAVNDENNPHLGFELRKEPHVRPIYFWYLTLMQQKTHQVLQLQVQTQIHGHNQRLHTITPIPTITFMNQRAVTSLNLTIHLQDLKEYTLLIRQAHLLK